MVKKMYIVLTYKKFINLKIRNKPVVGMKNYKKKTKLRTQQGKKITRNANLSLIQN
jgi:hypothetical protein